MIAKKDQSVNSLPHFIHLTTVSLSFNRSNFLEPHAGQIGQDLSFSITPPMLVVSLIQESIPCILNTYQQIEFIK